MIDPAAVEPEQLDTDTLLATLGEVADELNGTLEREQGLYDLRTRLILAGRNRSPRVTLGRLAEAGGMSEAAISQVLHKRRRQEAS